MKSRVQALLTLTLALAIAGLAGCDHYTCGSGPILNNTGCTASGPVTTGTGGNTNAITTFVYFADAGALALDGLNVNNSGTFEPVDTFVTPDFPEAQGEPAAIAGVLAVNKKYLYVPVSEQGVFGFSIDATSGALTAVPGSPYTTGLVYSAVADPTGRFLFVDGPTGILVYIVSATDGSLTPVTGSPFSTGGFVAGQMATDGLGKYLYAVRSFPGSEVLAFSYNQTSGELTPVPGSPFAFSMSEIAGEVSGQYLLGITQEVGEGGGLADNHVYVFGITQSGSSAGALTQVTGSPFATTNPPVNLAVSPNGAFVYTFNETGTGNGTISDPMEGYSLGSSGSLTALSTSPFTSLNASIGRFDQSGQYLIALAAPTEDTGGTYPYTVNTTTGALTSTLPYTGGPSNVYAVTDAP